MREVVAVTRLAQAKALLHPIRVELVHLLSEPRTCRELAAALGVSQQRLNHHLKEMRKVKLIDVVSTNRRNNLLEAVYQRTAKAYWLSPELLAKPGRERAEAMSLHNLQVQAEALQADVARLLDRAGNEEVPSLGLDLEVALRDDADREAFTRDLLRAIHRVAEAYQGHPDAPRYKLLVSAYPKVKESSDDA